MDPVRPEEEWVDLIDRDNRVIGRTSRREVRQKNLLHRGVGIICLNSGGEVYVHRRTDTKDVFPGLHDMFVGGVVSSGETYETSARREVAEELGIVGPEPVYLFRHLYEGPRNASWIQVYSVTWDGPIVHQPEEVAWGRWLPLDQLDDWIDEHEIVPDGLEVYREYRAHVQGSRSAEPPLP